VGLQLDRLSAQTTRKEVREALKVLPMEINETYDEAIERIKGQREAEASLAIKALLWIFCARRPLKIEELRHALQVKPDSTELEDDDLVEEDLLVSVCAGLVTIDEESNIIGLVHYTLQEYLGKIRGELFQNADADIARVCLTYLSFDVFKSGPCYSRESLNDRLEKYRFLDYASCNWGHHVREDQQAELVELVLRYLENGERLSFFHSGIVRSGNLVVQRFSGEV
jgi:hypothetical protein